MESKNRNVLIIVIAVAALLVACCCLLAGGVAAVAGLARASWETDVPPGKYQEQLEQTFPVGDAPSLRIDNFAGNVTVRAGESGEVRVVATKKASESRNLSLIGVGMHPVEDGLVIKTGRPLFGSAALDLEITAPADTRLDLKLGAGNASVRGLTGGAEADISAGSVQVEDMSGGIQVRCAAGSITASGVEGPVQLENDVGTIVYEGQPQGDCRFKTDTGAIAISLHGEPDLELDLHTSLGIIDVRCPVDGKITRRDVQGTIGSGDQGRIVARGGVGGIGLICR